MLVLQQNCGKGYECIVAALEPSLGLEVSIVCIQELFLGNRSLAHTGFNLYWPSGTDNQRDMQVLIAVKKDILNRFIIDNQTDLISHPYCLCLDIKEFDPKSGKSLRKTRIVNLYDNKVGQEQLWEGSCSRVQRAIEDIGWRQVIRGRVLIVEDMNAHSPSWNPHCRQRQNAGPLKEMIETYDLFVNNNTDFSTRPRSWEFSIIDLALTNPDLGVLRVWEILEEYPLLSGHELILLEWGRLRDKRPRKISASYQKMEY